jgi:hypothetical protein
MLWDLGDVESSLLSDELLITLQCPDTVRVYELSTCTSVVTDTSGLFQYNDGYVQVDFVVLGDLLRIIYHEDPLSEHVVGAGVGSDTVIVRAYRFRGLPASADTSVVHIVD